MEDIALSMMFKCMMALSSAASDISGSCAITD
jgi:hypothetical protein